MGHVFIGLSGYSYTPWQGPGRFYPSSLKQADFLQYYATRFSTVEMDGIWYRIPSEQAVRNWIDSTPDGFIFAPKANRQITHLHRFKPEALKHVQRMLDRLAPLNDAKRLGPTLLQLPPNFVRDDARLTTFLDGLPAQHRWAIEFRNPSWHAPEVVDILHRHQIAWTIAETDEQQPARHDTGNFWYLRLRRSQYGDESLRQWAEWIKHVTSGDKDCYVYFKHEDEGSPWVWADQLRALLSTST
jgi:uncharacterized protein YecE (DUF72 family)